MEKSELIKNIRSAFDIPVEKRNIGKNERIISAIAGLLVGLYASRRRTAFPLFVPAGYLIYRGVTGYCHINALTGRNTSEGARPFTLSKSINIARDRTEVYYYWRNLENFPFIMKHIQRVQKINDKEYHWEAIFNNKKFMWNARITEEIPDQKISWQSLESADISNSGSVEFIDAPGHKGTELKVTINYHPSETETGKIIAGFLNPLFKKVVSDDLNEFKRKVESGEITITKPYVNA
jgi:uncharacterized membrane protein